MIPSFIVATVVGISMALAAGGIASGWLHISLIILGVLIGLIGFFSIGFSSGGNMSASAGISPHEKISGLQDVLLLNAGNIFDA